MNSLHIEDWKKHRRMALTIMGIFTKHKVTFDYGLWCPKIWAGSKGETVCADALFHITMEAAALEAWQDDTPFRKALLKWADMNGYWWEQGYHWSIHLYKK